MDDRRDEPQIDPALSRRMDMEMRREMEAAELDAAVLEAKRRTLADLAREFVSRGDELTLASGDFEVAGIGTYARGDLLTMRAPRVIVEVNLRNVDWIRVDRRVASGGQSSPVEAQSFAARLGLLEITAERVELVGRGGSPRLHGRITAVARDHLAVEADAGRPWYLSLSSVAAVIRQASH